MKIILTPYYSSPGTPLFAVYQHRKRYSLCYNPLPRLAIAFYSLIPLFSGKKDPVFSAQSASRSDFAHSGLWTAEHSLRWAAGQALFSPSVQARYFAGSFSLKIGYFAILRVF
jgi:hypothetical protein